jgi:hypothetical protein
MRNAGAKDDDCAAAMLANRLLAIRKPFGLVWAPPRWLPRLKQMARRLGARTKIDGSRWGFTMPGMAEITNEDFFCYGRSDNKADWIFPHFFFDRRPDIEAEAGYALAGTLYIDFPKSKLKAGRDKPPKELQEIMIELAKRAKETANCIVIGWNGPKPPYGDEITDDDKLMAEWAKDKLAIVLRVASENIDPSEMPMDSDLLLKCGFGRDGKLIH